MSFIFEKISLQMKQKIEYHSINDMDKGLK